MTDITADEYRTAAKVARTFGMRGEAEHFETSATRLEGQTESADLVTELAAYMLNEHEAHEHAYRNAIGRWREEWDGHANDALTYLGDHGRLVPEGGRILTAEDAAWLSLIVTDLGRESFSEEAWARLRALFPATEPAEVVVRHGSGRRPWGYHEPAPADECQNDNHDPGCICGAQHWMTTPAPAVPTEEETKAGCPSSATGVGGVHVYCSLQDGHRGDHYRPASGRIHTWHNPASSPVVPAPTETEWARIEDVPADVTVLDCDGIPWRYVDCHWRCTEDVGGPYSLRLINQLAPFVAAGEGDA